MAILVLIFVWNGTIPNLHEKICLLMFVTGVALQSESDQVCGSYSRKPVRGQSRISIQMYTVMNSNKLICLLQAITNLTALCNAASGTVEYQ